jgi:hypothetical protein
MVKTTYLKKTALSPRQLLLMWPAVPDTARLRQEWIRERMTGDPKKTALF